MRLENIDSLQSSIAAAQKASSQATLIKTMIKDDTLNSRRLSYIDQAVKDTVSITTCALQDLIILTVRMAKIFQGFAKIYSDPKKGVKLIRLNSTLVITGAVRLTILDPLAKTILTLGSIAGIVTPKRGSQLRLAGYTLEYATHTIEAKIKEWFENSPKDSDIESVNGDETDAESLGGGGPEHTEDSAIAKKADDLQTQHQPVIDELKKTLLPPETQRPDEIADNVREAEIAQLQKSISELQSEINIKRELQQIWLERTQNGSWTTNPKSRSIAQKQLKSHGVLIDGLTKRLTDLEEQLATFTVLV